MYLLLVLSSLQEHLCVSVWGTIPTYLQPGFGSNGRTLDIIFLVHSVLVCPCIPAKIYSCSSFQALSSLISVVSMGTWIVRYSNSLISVVSIGTWIVRYSILSSL